MTDEVKVTGVTKGKGFAGVVKRWNFAGGPKTHGQSDRHRAPGSIGAGTTPGRVLRGKKMAGHMGVSRLTVTGLEVVGVDVSESLLLVKGSIPGPRGGFVVIQKTGEFANSAFAITQDTEKGVEGEDGINGVKGTEGHEVQEVRKGEEIEETKSGTGDEDKSAESKDGQKEESADTKSGGEVKESGE